MPWFSYCAAEPLISLEFDKLIRMVQRQQNVSEPVPPFYIRTLIGLESSLNAALAKEKEAKKKMNATNAKALTATRQRVKKVFKEYEKEIKSYQAVRIVFSDCSMSRANTHTGS